MWERTQHSLITQGFLYQKVADSCGNRTVILHAWMATAYKEGRNGRNLDTRVPLWTEGKYFYFICFYIHLYVVNSCRSWRFCKFRCVAYKWHTILYVTYHIFRSIRYLQVGIYWCRIYVHLNRTQISLTEGIQKQQQQQKSEEQKNSTQDV